MIQWATYANAIHSMNLRYGCITRTGEDTFSIRHQVTSNRAISDPSVHFKETWPRPHELPKVVHPDELVEVRSCKDDGTRDVRRFRITRVISPFRFYADYDINYPHGGFRHWQGSFQNFYNSQQSSKFISKCLRKFRCYAHYNAEYNEWERVRVFRQNHKLRLAEVFVCDYPVFKIVKFETLRELKPEFAAWSAQGFRMHLIHVKPKGGGMIWSKEAVDFFKTLVQRKSFDTIVMRRSDNRLPDGFPDYTQDFSVIMLNTEQGKRSLQAELVKAGFGEATGMSAGYAEMLEVCETKPTFNLDLLYMSPPSQFISSDSQPPRDIPSKAEVIRYVDEIKRDLETLKKQSALRPAEILEKMSRKVDITRRYTSDLEQLPKGVQHKLGYVRVCHLSNPGMIFVQIKSQVAKLIEMEAVIATLCANEIPLSIEDKRVGIMVASVYQTDRGLEPSWVRCMVIDVGFLGEDVVKLLVIDHGVILTVKRDQCRYLPDFFKPIPSFAHRVHLDFGSIVPAGGKSWSADASEVFRKYIQSWESQEPLYYIWTLADSKPIELEDMHQIVQYNYLENQWEAGVAREFPGTRHRFVDIPILKSLFTSVGVEMVFEIIQKSNTYWFQYLTHVLLDGGYAVDRIPQIGIPVKHKSIVRALNNANIFNSQLATCMESNKNSNEDED